MKKFYVLGYLFSKDGGIEGEIFPTGEKDTDLKVRVEEHITKKGTKCHRIVLEILKDETKEGLVQRVIGKLLIHKNSQNFEKGWNIKEENIQLRIDN